MHFFCFQAKLYPYNNTFVIFINRPKKRCWIETVNNNKKFSTDYYRFSIGKENLNIKHET